MGDIENIGRYESGISYKKIIFWFFLLILIIAVSVAYFSFSRAVIEVYPKKSEKEVEIEINLDSNVTNIDLGTKTMRGVLITETEQEKKIFKDLPPKKIEENSSGSVVIHNGYTRALGFKAGDILIAENGGGKIALKNNVIVYRNQTKTVEAYFTEKGEVGNIAPTVFKFEKFDDFMNEQVSAKSEENFSGGTRMASLILESDIEEAKKELARSLREKNFVKLKNKIREGEEISDNHVVDVIENFRTNIEPPKEVDGFEAEMRLKSVGVVFKKENLLQLVKEELKKEATSDQEFLDLRSEDLQLGIISISSENNQAKISVKVKGEFRAKVSSRVFNKEEIKGFNSRAVMNYYQDFSEIEKVEIKFFPSFRKTVPEMDNRIIIEIKE